MAEADWSQLPKDLLQLISKKLNSEFYQLRFRSVCSSWRSSIPPNNHYHLLNLPSKFPIPSEPNNNAPNYPLSKRTIFLITPPPNQEQTLNPCLIKIGPDSHGRTCLWDPLLRDNHLRLHFPQLIIDFNQLSVLDLGHEFVIGDFPSKSQKCSILNTIMMKKVVVYNKLHNGNDACFLLTIHISGKLVIFRSGDENWMMLPEIPSVPYTDVCVFGGQPIAVDSTGRTVAVGPDLSLDLVAEAVFGGNTKLLVESDGELLLVDKYLAHSGVTCSFTFNPEGVYQIGIDRVVRFVVFRLDEKEKKWVKLTSLRDKIMFMGEDSAFTVSASDLCIENGNCVIFRDNNVYSTHLSTNGCGIGVFCLDNHRNSPLFDLSTLFRPPSQRAWLR